MSRTSDCNNGGDLIEFDITNPTHNTFITGVHLVLTPYIPGQDAGKEN